MLFGVEENFGQIVAFEEGADVRQKDTVGPKEKKVNVPGRFLGVEAH